MNIINKNITWDMRMAMKNGRTLMLSGQSNTVPDLSHKHVLNGHVSQKRTMDKKGWKMHAIMIATND